MEIVYKKRKIIIFKNWNYLKEERKENGNNLDKENLEGEFDDFRPSTAGE